MNIYITSKTFGKIASNAFLSLKKTPFKINFKKNIIDSKFIENKADILILGADQINDTIFKSKRLKLICRIGSGNDNVPVEYCKKNNIALFNTKTSLAQSVTELVLALTLNSIRNITLSSNDIKSGHWNRYLGKELNEISYGIIGYGEIGKKLSQNLIKLGVKEVHIYDPFIKNKKINKKNIIINDNLNHILKSCDFISLHVPLNKNTRNLINKNNISNIKNGSTLINTSRGEIICEESLYSYLKKNKQSMAALDVFKNEPYKGKLKKLQNVLMSPHQGSYTKKTRLKMEEEIIYKIVNFYEKNCQN